MEITTDRMGSIPSHCKREWARKAASNPKAACEILITFMTPQDKENPMPSRA